MQCSAVRFSEGIDTSIDSQCIHAYATAKIGCIVYVSCHFLTSYTHVVIHLPVLPCNSTLCPALDMYACE
jgi:hypothetical protein